MKRNLSKSVQVILKIAKDEAIRLGHSYVGSEHLLLGIILDHNSKAGALMESIGVSLSEMHQKLETILKPVGGTITLGHLPLTRRAERILRNTFIEAEKLNKKIADDTHLLLAITRESEGIAKEVLEDYNIDYDLLITYITSLEKTDQYLGTRTTSSTPTLDIFSRNFSALAAEDKLDPVIERSVEIERVAQILARRKKNNPVLIGEPGVGKTAIVEGLAIRIYKKIVPRILWGKRVLALDLAGLIAGTKYRGQFEERMQKVMQELEKTTDVIIFIDELHTIVGAGAASGSLDAANMFKPALARGEIQVIGATTLNEYQKYIEKDGALERRFQKILVDPPSIGDTVKILKGLQPKYEEHHQIKYLPEAITACVDLSERYIRDKFLPDKAIDVLDEVGSRIHISNIYVPDNILKLEKEIRELRGKKEQVIKNQQFEVAASLRDKERKLVKKLQDTEFEWNTEKNRVVPEVNKEDVASVISMMTGIPVNQVAESESQRLIRMSQEIGKHIIGQSESVDILCQSIKRARAGFKNPDHPIGSFLFLGPTGVGKTELAKVLAKYLFNNDESLIKIDMSEYMERHNVSRLIGAPPGYVGYDEGGQLTERVRRHPFSVILFDEVEKAHPDVFNILLQILDEGKISDSIGRIVDFRNTIIILTSNLGTKNISTTTIGFSKGEGESQYAKIKSDINIELKRIFKPEFLNRLDELIIFRSLVFEDLLNIIDLQLKDIRSNLREKNIQFKMSKKAKLHLIENCNYQEWGARPLRRMIQREIENTISEKFLTGEFKEGGNISLKIQKNSFVFIQTFNSRTSAPSGKKVSHCS